VHQVGFALHDCTKMYGQQNRKFTRKQNVTSFPFQNLDLTLILLTWRIWRVPYNASKWQIGFNSSFKGLMTGKNNSSFVCYSGLTFRNKLRS